MGGEHRRALLVRQVVELQPDHSAPGTPNHVRLVATNSRGTTAGSDMAFTTTPAPPPAGTYTNPVFGSFPDPMAMRTGADYYAYATGANFPIVHSTPGQLEQRRRGVQRGDVPRMEQRESLGAECARDD